MEIHITELILLSLISLFLPMSALAEVGIASKYHRDQGIADDLVVATNYIGPINKREAGIQ